MARVLVVGGSGYLGQHLLQRFAEMDGRQIDMAFTYHSNPPRQLLDAISPALSFRVDLKTGEGFDEIIKKFGQMTLSEGSRFFVVPRFRKVSRKRRWRLLTNPDIVINCAALSVPRACEVDPDGAMAINVPSFLVNWLASLTDNNTVLIHLSTDQVYEGSKSFYREVDETVPVNMYGKSKLAAEEFIRANYRNYVILRSSIIYGPQTISPVPKSLPIQWIDDFLAQGNQVEFFHDEYRCPVYVKDVVNVVLAVIQKWTSGSKEFDWTLNVGGVDRVSRLQMAEAVAACRGYDHSLIKPVSASTVNRGVVSPADISMDITRLTQLLGVIPIPFKDGVKLTLGICGTS